MSRSRNNDASVSAAVGGDVSSSFEGDVPWLDSHEATLLTRQQAEHQKAEQQNEERRKAQRVASRRQASHQAPRGRHEEDATDSASLSIPTRITRPTSSSRPPPNVGSRREVNRGGPQGRTPSLGLISIPTSEDDIPASDSTYSADAYGADVSAGTDRVGAFAVAPGATAQRRYVAHNAGDNYTVVTAGPETVVAHAVTTDDLADQLRQELRSEIRNELQALQSRTISAEVVRSEPAASASTPINNDSASNSVSVQGAPVQHSDESKRPFWRTKCFIITAVLLVVAVIGGVAGGVVAGSGGGDGGDANVTIVGNPSPSPDGSPTVSPEEFPTLAPVTGPTIQPITQPPELPSAPPSLRPVSNVPTRAPTTPPTQQLAPPPTRAPTPPLSQPPTPPPTLPPSTGFPPPTRAPTPPPSQPPTPPPTLPPSTGTVNIQQTLQGIENDDNFGTYVEFSRDGTTLAVGANGANAVIMYRRSGNGWQKIGQTIRGSGSFGARLDLNQDGSILVVGAGNNDDGGRNAGKVQAFRLNESNQWNQLGQDLIGNEPGDEFGWDVTISDDGDVVAVSARNGDPSSDRTDAGYVQVYMLDENIRQLTAEWKQRGPGLEGEASEDQFGRSVAISSDGFTVAVGAVRGGGGTGRVSVFRFSGGAWNQVGQALDGEANEDFQGTSVALSSTGSTLAVAADGNDSNGSLAGLIRVYRLSGSFWEQVGQNILGQASGDQLGAGHISLSSDGDTLAVGANHNDNDRGEGYLFRYNGSSSQWVQIAEVRGDSSGDRYGDSVNVSGDGSLFAVGAPLSSNSPGYVRVFAVV